MKILIRDQKIIATATDEYDGEEVYITAPPDFDISKLDQYRYIDSVLTLVPSRKITRLAFRNRFTTTEKVTLEMASIDNPAGTLASRQAAAGLRVNLADQANATFIDLDRVDTRAGVQQLETYGLLAAGRALIILDTAVTTDELYKGVI